MNKVIISGRLTKDVNINNAGAAPVGRMTVAVDRRFKREGQPTADFIGIVMFGERVEKLAPYLVKGKAVEVEGRIQTGSYEKDGQRVYTTDIVVENIELGSGGKSETPAKEGFEEPELDENGLPFAD